LWEGALVLVFLVTGPTGAGKSSVARRLQQRGHHAISLDSDPLLCAWTDADGHRVVRPAEPDLAWLAVHRWTWDADRLDEIIADAGRRRVDLLWLCGYAANALQLAGRFDVTFLLDISRDTMIRRLRGRPAGNDFGLIGETLSAASAYYREFIGPWRRGGAVTIDASHALDRVVEDLLLAATEAALDLPDRH
jgi:adenylate kinase family enzyme